MAKPPEPGRASVGRWSPVAGDDRVRHYFTVEGQGWWRAAIGGAGPAVGPSDHDERLGFCPTCRPGDESSAGLTA